ncbi:MAG: PEP/pyruvate-binding domain-containing protein [Chloroflexi bacterium]|nr:PEP/pyruvate-binding domain-containing protein [Chloroflexota bacterium]
MYILWLGHPLCHERSLVGGKAANLSRLAEAYRVPPGFCLTTQAYDLAVAHSVAADAPGPECPGLPPDLVEPVAGAYRELAQRCQEAEPGVAVRSSAVDEDGATASFAGQYETFLNVAGIKAVSQVIAQCWASAHSARVAEYRRQHSLEPHGGRLAVLVQQLILADVSAVAFGANPVSGSRDEIVINASWGLGESIVGGTVTPDTFVVRRADLAILSRLIADKRRMTVAVPGGTREVDVPRFLRTQTSLDEDQVVEIAHLLMAIEDSTGWPADVECAYRSGELYLLQCRPITTV